jgi:hypothetical protein
MSGEDEIKGLTLSSLLVADWGIMDGVSGRSVSLEECSFEGITREEGNGSVIIEE